VSKLKANTRRNGDVTIVDLSGQITLGENSILLRQTIKELAAQGERKILLNLAGVAFIDSGGLGELVTSHANLSREGGRIKLLHLQKRVSDLLQLTKVTTIFEIYTNEAIAVLSME
jgi:anti-sigma B factor antagonist